ncbi:MAG: NAD(P)/FAD-dependent oxidoreductase [Pedobacter sp.]|jgi:2-polyprenyl-6-methoxyphenol hydroxylase-like FAD-dependent oxidoreductase|uniref:FAD-dependent oxidoreductase n=1 Tax=Pedobacter sp. TaxID=1411316 RepID=UPI0035634340
MLLQNKTIAIVGGGPGGLTLARLLQLKGATVKVYERDLNKDARVQGTTLDLHEESGLKALRQAHLLDAFKENYRPGADRMIIVNENAEIFFSDHEGKPEEDFGNEHFRPEIDRGPLRKILLESLQPDTVVWDSQFVVMEKQNEGWLLHFKNGTSAYADIVIGADGANSKIRPYITDIRAFYSGISGLMGTVYNPEIAVPNIHKLLKDGKIMAFGGGKNLTVATKGDGSMAFYLSYKVEESRLKNLDLADKSQMLSLFKNDLAEWDTMWHELFENAEMPFMLFPIYCMPLNQTWTALQNLTMLGDAAHLMPPFAGEGVNMAMLDALELSDYLCNENFNDTQTAIASYEKQMRERAAVAAYESLENGDKMHSKDALQIMLSFFNEHRN